MKAARLDEMEQYILQNERASIQELIKRFGISINTLRRDLDELEARGHITKYYGGAEARALTALTPVPERFHKNARAKRLIGELASAEVPPDSTVFVDSGSTASNVVHGLEGRGRFTILSHSLSVLSESARLKEVNTISPGGIYNAAIGAFVGLSTYEAIRSMSVQVAVMAATGVSIKHGLSNTTYFEAEIKRLVTSNCEKIILVADHSKFGVEAMVTYCPLERVSTVVTDARPREEYLEFFDKHSIRLRCVEDEQQKAPIQR